MGTWGIYLTTHKATRLGKPVAVFNTYQECSDECDRLRAGVTPEGRVYIMRSIPAGKAVR